ncbi:MAG: SMI1/KNR4 family protein [Gemmataceae bacterium]|nr:SMI1/KNR4 family protein [Gemmataceae bacterium]
MDERLRQALLAARHACPEEDRHQPAAESELQAFEAEFGLIPPAFREYLAVCGGRVGGDGEWIDGLPELPDSHRQFRADSEFWRMRGVFIIGWDGAGNPFGIELSSGRVLVEDHNFGGIHEMAPSFTAFLAAGLSPDAEPGLGFPSQENN